MNKVFNKIEEMVLNTHYTDSSLHRDEFVGRVKKDDFLSVIEKSEFETIGGDYIKQFNEKQLHLFSYDGSEIKSGDDGYTYLYAHYENKWGTGELLTPEKNGPEGVRRIKKMLNENGVNYEPVRP